MASGLFGSGPQSNILQTVQSSYAGMLNAEKQKGVAMREAMGAFGQAIDPKTIGMNKFKKQFADSDWTKPSTYFEASKFISAFDPSGAMSMAQNGMQLQASQAPKRDMQWVDQIDPATGITSKVAVDMNAVQAGDTFTNKIPETNVFEYKAPKEFTNPSSNIKEWKQQQQDGTWKTIGMAGNQVAPKDGAPDSREVWDPKLKANIMQSWDPTSKTWVGSGIAPKTGGGSGTTGTPTPEMKNAAFIYPNSVEDQQNYILEQTAITDSASKTTARNFLSTLDPDLYVGESIVKYEKSINNGAPDASLLVRYEAMSPKAEVVLTEAQDASFQSLNKAGTAEALAEKLNPDALVQTTEGEEVKASLSSGWQARAGSAIKDFFGSQDEVSEIRTEFTRIKNLEVIGSLPPGVASDKDIEIVSAGFPDANANPKVLYNWLKSYANIQRADAEFNRFKAAYISKNNNSKGFIGDWKKYSKVPVSELAKYRSVINNSNIDNAEINKIFSKKFGFNPEGVL